MANFLHQKKNSSIWYYRRRYPQEVAKALKKTIFMQSLKTHVRKEAEKLARKKSVEFDEACERALQYCSQSMQPEVEPTGSVKEALSEQAVEQIINNVPSLVRRGYEIVLEEQKRAPYDDQWQPRVKALQEFFRSMKRGVVPPQSQRTPAEAQALLNGMDMALRGQPLPDTLIKRESGDVVSARANGTWEDLCQKALNRYRDRVSYPRYQLAVRSLKQITVVSTATADVEDALRAWAKCRLECVSPRTVKNQLTSVTSALREAVHVKIVVASFMPLDVFFA